MRMIVMAILGVMLAVAPAGAQLSGCQYTSGPVRLQKVRSTASGTQIFGCINDSFEVISSSTIQSSTGSVGTIGELAVGKITGTSTSGGVTISSQTTHKSSVTIEANAFSVGGSTVVVKDGQLIVGSTAGISGVSILARNPSGNALIQTDSNSGGNPQYRWSQAGSAVAYGFYDNANAILTLNRTGSTATGLMVNGSDRVIIGAGGTPLAVVSTGTYTPTITSVANVTSTSNPICRYDRLADVVKITCYVEIAPTAAGNATTSIGISLPPGHTSNFTGSTNAIGTITCQGVQRAGGVTADTTNDRLQATFASEVSANNSFMLEARYIIQ